jgi:hypothetical protein
MRLDVTPRFKRAYKKKTKQQQAKVDNAIGFLQKIPDTQEHHSRGTDGIWECYIDDSFSITFERGEGFIRLRNNCNHDIIYRPLR